MGQYDVFKFGLINQVATLVFVLSGEVRSKLNHSFKFGFSMFKWLRLNTKGFREFETVLRARETVEGLYNFRGYFPPLKCLGKEKVLCCFYITFFNWEYVQSLTEQ